MKHTKIKPYNPVKRAVGVPKKPVFPKYKTGLHPHRASKVSVFCRNGPWADCRILLTRDDNGECSTGLIKVSGYRGYYAYCDFMSVMWVDVP